MTTALEPIRRLSDAEIEALRATLPTVTPYVPLDPYRPLAAGVRLVDFYRPSFCRGPAQEPTTCAA